MPFSLITGNWNGVLLDLADLGTALRIVCPFIQRRPLERLLARVGNSQVELVTRFDLEAFARGVSDLDALSLLLARGAQIRGVRHVHAKLYLFGDRAVVGTSANLTDSGLFRNAEFGFRSDEPAVVAGARAYWEQLWSSAGANLTHSKLDGWKPIVMKARLGSLVRQRLPDEGVSLTNEQQSSEVEESAFTPVAPAFVKFFREGHLRAHRSTRVLDAVNGAGCHYACTYPHHPWQPQAGDIMYMADMVSEPNDTMIYGRACVVRAHDPEHDVASVEEKARRGWKEKWPYYIRVHGPEFLRGQLGEGISLDRMMRELGHEAFESTSRNFAKGSGNLSPGMAIRQKPAVKLSTVGSDWLHAKFEQAIRRRGLLDAAELDALGRD